MTEMPTFEELVRDMQRRGFLKAPKHMRRRFGRMIRCGKDRREIGFGVSRRGRMFAHSPRLRCLFPYWRWWSDERRKGKGSAWA